jgi:hypothetical protein
MDTWTMSRKERKRLEVMAQLRKRKLALVQAAEAMGVSYRQSKRVWRAAGIAGTPGWCSEGGDGPAGGAWRPTCGSRKGSVLNIDTSGVGA